jgi:hypothetical protein
MYTYACTYTYMYVSYVCAHARMCVHSHNERRAERESSSFVAETSRSQWASIGQNYGVGWQRYGLLSAPWGCFHPYFYQLPPYGVQRIHWYSYTDSYVPGCWVLIVVASRIPRSTYFSFTCSNASLHILARPSAG